MGETRRIDLAQCVDWANRPLQKIDWAQGRHAQTDAIVRGVEAWSTPDGVSIPAARVELRPLTGRTHQLRLAAATPAVISGPAGVRVSGGLGRPIVGDRLYGEAALAPRLLLHARRLGFWHPWTGAWSVFDSPEPF